MWVKRSALAWLTETASAAGVPRSALVRELLIEAIAARQDTEPAAAPDRVRELSARPARPLQLVTEPVPQHELELAATARPCRRCSCADYARPTDQVSFRCGACGHATGEHML